MLPSSGESPGLAIAVIVIAALVGAFMSALTAALAALPDELLMAIRDEGGRDGESAARLLEHRATIGSRLTAGRVGSVAAMVTGTAMVVGHGEPIWVTVAVVALAALLYAMLSELSQTIGRSRARATVLTLFRWSRPFELAFAPFAFPLELVSRAVQRYFPLEKTHMPMHIAEREVEHIIEARENTGAISEEYAELLLRVLEFKDTVAREIMVPRTRLIAIEASTPIDEVIALINEQGHSRYPVYRGRLDRIEGILYAKDLFRAAGSRESSPLDLGSLLRKPVLFVAETQKIGTLLREMQARRQHLAVIVDEFGGTSGLVTLEDIVEEIVGEIHDEHDEEEKLVTEVAPGTYQADARISIYELGEALDAPSLEGLDEGEYDSLGGLVVELAGRVPEKGERLSVDGFDLLVLEADEKHVTRVEIRRRPLSEVPPAPDVADAG